MNLAVVTFNFKTTPIELREKLALSTEQAQVLMREIREQCRLDEVMVVSTCNRVEFYFADEPNHGGCGRLTEWLKNWFGVEARELEKAAVVLTQRAALTHLFRVASSLEAMVLGEPQVLGQVKEAYQLTVDQKCQGPLLTGLMPRVFRTAKRVRSETGIARFPVSISYVAVQLASTIFESLEDKTVMVIGAGEMAELTVVHLLKAGVKRPLLTNRTFQKAVALAEKFQGSALRFEELESHLADADIVITSTGSQHFVVTQALARRAVKKRRGEPIFFIDIAVPRDVDPEVNQLANVYVYDIDDLQAVADSNRQEREREALSAQVIIEEELDHYEKWVEAQQVVPTIKAMRRYLTDIGEKELEKMLSKSGHFKREDTAAVRLLVRGIIKKILHMPSLRLKEMGHEANGPMYVDALAALFDIQPEATEISEKESASEPLEEAGEEAGNVLQLRISPSKSS